VKEIIKVAKKRSDASAQSRGRYPGCGESKSYLFFRFLIYVDVVFRYSIQLLRQKGNRDTIIDQ
jgi:hypothetical protein